MNKNQAGTVQQDGRITVVNDNVRWTQLGVDRSESIFDALGFADVDPNREETFFLDMIKVRIARTKCDSIALLLQKGGQ